MPWAASNGARIWWEEEGDRDAPALLLVRGFARSSRYWLDFQSRMAERHRVVVMDNRGIGRSDSPRPPYSTRAMADDAAAVLEAAGVPRAHVFGISLGGMIAQWIALSHAARVDRLVLACTTPGGRAARRTPLDAMLALLRSGAMPFPEAIRYTAPWVVPQEFAEDNPHVIDTWERIATEEPATVGGLVGQAVAALSHDASRHLGRIDAETLVLTGDADRLMPADNSYRLAERIPRARLRVVPGAGHDVPTERPEELARELETFLAP